MVELGPALDGRRGDRPRRGLVRANGSAARADQLADHSTLRCTIRTVRIGLRRGRARKVVPMWAVVLDIDYTPCATVAEWSSHCVMRGRTLHKSSSPISRTRRPDVET